MKNNYFVSFNFDNIFDIETKYYHYETNQPDNYSFIDTKNYVHGFKYEFYSTNLPVESGLYNVAYKIECSNIVFFNKCSKYDFVFEFENKEKTILNYDLLLNNECIMKIKIKMQENYNDDDVENVISLLENNIVIIKGTNI